MVDTLLLLESGLARPALLFDKVILSDYIGLKEVVRSRLSPDYLRHLRLDYNHNLPPRNAVGEFARRLAGRLVNHKSIEIIESIENLDALLNDIDYMIKQGVYAPAPAYLYPGLEHEPLAILYPTLYVQPFDTTLYLDALQQSNMDVKPYIMRDPMRITEVSKPVEQRDVLQLVLKRMPIPRSNIPLQDIIQFRKDGEASRKLWALRNWANKIVKTADNPSEIEDEFMALYGTFVDHMRLLDQDLESTTLGLVMTVASDFVDNLFHLKIGSALKSLVDWRHKKLDIEKERLQVPGNELSYLRAVEETFSKCGR